jgi:hypothetical protein
MKVENLRDMNAPGVCPPLAMTGGKGMGVSYNGFTHYIKPSIHNRYRMSSLHGRVLSPRPRSVKTDPLGNGSIQNSCAPSPPYVRFHTRVMPLRSIRAAVNRINISNNGLCLYKGRSHRHIESAASVHLNSLYVNTCSRIRGAIDELIRSNDSRPASGNSGFYEAATDLNSSRSYNSRSK